MKTALTDYLSMVAVTSGLGSLCSGVYALVGWSFPPHILPAQPMFVAIWLSGVCLAAMVAMILVRN
jgi:hypothetical protein